jgi:hypothetical protein
LTLASVGQIVGNYWPVTSRHKPGKIVKLFSLFLYIENYNWGIIEYIIQLMTVCDDDNDCSDDSDESSCRK